MRSSSRPARLLTVIVSLWALLFAQVSIAAYACPVTERAAEIAKMAQAGMPCAEAMAAAPADEGEPALCHAHCQSAHPSADHFQPGVPASVEDFGAVLAVAPAPAGPRARAPLDGPRRDGGPPLSIRNCCFRI